MVDEETGDEQTRFAPSARIATRVVDGRAVVVVVDTQELHTFNELGTRIWEWLPDATVGAMADRIVAEFDVDRERALRDVWAFCRELERLGAATRVAA